MGAEVIYRVWFNRGAEPEAAWVIEDQASKEQHTALSVAVNSKNGCYFPPVHKDQCPQGFCEVRGTLHFIGMSAIIE
jgi:hypothetical protein